MEEFMKKNIQIDVYSLLKIKKIQILIFNDYLNNKFKKYITNKLMYSIPSSPKSTFSVSQTISDESG